MKILSREECEKALENLMKKGKGGLLFLILGVIDDLACFKNLIEEHFELVENYNKLTDLNNMSEHQLLTFNTLANAQIKDRKCDLCLYKIGNDIQAYKFEQLKEGMWVWDDKNEDCIKIEQIEHKTIWYSCCNEEGHIFEDFKENRFYPVTKALQYQGEYKGNGK